MVTLGVLMAEVHTSGEHHFEEDTLEKVVTFLTLKKRQSFFITPLDLHKAVN